ncbi:unnamed protein product [Gongylonema pulchrum]|uniref:Uncharacterized protein n=1 Tax=Gongylonema pulchrum TaxID=637853 RepID=A0A3P6P0P3_9BILA|nr:unnamed protein product [Gongylonema pulchrum]
MLDAIVAFLRAFVVEECVSAGPRQVASFSIEKKQLTTIDITPVTRPMIDFCVLGSQPQQLKSPLCVPDRLLSVLSGVFSVFIIAETSDERSSLSSTDKEWALSRLRERSLPEDFDVELRKISSGVIGILQKGSISQRLRNALQALNLPAR